MECKDTAVEVGYVCNVADDELRQARGIDSDSPAALQKILGICRALRAADVDVAVFSAGRGRCRASGRWFDPISRISDDLCVHYAAGFDRAGIGRLVSALSLCASTLRATRRGSALIFYNAQIDYAPTLVAARLLGRRCVLDLEDGINWDSSGLRSRADRWVFRAFRTLCRSGGALLATSALASEVPDYPTVVIHGVATGEAIARDHSTSGELNVLFSGSLLEDTGGELFLETLAVLAREYPDAWARLRFVVSGYGPFAGPIAAAARGRFSENLDFVGRVSRVEYERLLARCRVGLCLKLPTSLMGRSTFPSKVLEFADAGLAVISTRVGDVPRVFPEGTAVLIPAANPHGLASALVTLALHPNLVDTIARAGQTRVRSIAGVEAVGAQLRAFLRGPLPSSHEDISASVEY
jgi:glycosyltransferase involved in cell wall biosynthesis